ncbi:MAG: hypothetical protein JNL34_12390 [Anaerolineae bacterium]|nr:hypothetical protein [Anaerolineae bacterium]
MNDRPAGRMRRWPAMAGRAGLVFALYLGAAVLITWPLVTHLNTQLIGHPFSDTTEYTRHIWRITEALRAGQFDYFTHDPLLLYPNGITAYWLWSAPLQSFPQALLTLILPLAAAHNGVALVTLALNGLAMWALMRWLLNRPLTPDPSPPQAERGETLMPDGADVGARHALPLGTQHSNLSPLELPAFLAGLVFAIYPAFQGQLGAGHTGLLVLWPMPLYILCLMRAAQGERPRWGWMAAAGVLFAVSQWGNLLLLLYLVLPFTALYLLALVWQRRWRGLGWALLAVGFGVLCSLPFALPILGDAAGGAVAREDGVVRYSASLLTIAAPSFYNPLYSGMAWNRAILGRDPFEGAGYAGLFAAALAVLAAVKIRRARFWLLLAALAWVASLGPLLKIFDTPVSLSADGHPSYIALPWALVQNLPILNLIRTPVRFNFTIGLAMAVLAGYGAFVIGEWAAKRWSRRAANGLLALAALLIVVDFQWFLPMPTIDAEVPAAVRALGEDDAIRAVFDVPWQHPLTDKDALYLQTGHGLPLIGGHITRRTPLDPAKGMLLQESLDPFLLNAAGADVIILHKQWDDDPAARAGQLTEHFGPPLYEDDRIAVWRVPHDESAAPRFVTVDQLTGTLAGSRSLHFFAPEAGEAALTLTLTSATPRQLSLTLDGQPIAAPFTGASFAGEEAFSVPLAFGEGMHTLTLAADPPCPPEPYPALECAAVEISAVRLDTP